MKITVKLVSMGPTYPRGFDNVGVGTLALPTGATLDQALSRLPLPPDDAHATLVNDESVPPDARSGRVLQAGDTLTLFPAIKGG